MFVAEIDQTAADDERAAHTVEVSEVTADVEGILSVVLFDKRGVQHEIFAYNGQSGTGSALGNAHRLVGPHSHKAVELGRAQINIALELALVGERAKSASVVFKVELIQNKLNDGAILLTEAVNGVNKCKILTVTVFAVLVNKINKFVQILDNIKPLVAESKGKSAVFVEDLKGGLEMHLGVLSVDARLSGTLQKQSAQGGVGDGDRSRGSGRCRADRSIIVGESGGNDVLAVAIGIRGVSRTGAVPAIYNELAEVGVVRERNINVIKHTAVAADIGGKLGIRAAAQGNITVTVIFSPLVKGGGELRAAFQIDNRNSNKDLKSKISYQIPRKKKFKDHGADKAQ